jgi:hypothetical protein
MPPFDGFDDFTGTWPDPSIWCDVTGDVLRMREGVLSMNRESDDGWVGAEVKPCLSGPLQAVEVSLTVFEGVELGQVGLIASLDSDGSADWFASYGIRHDGDIFLQTGIVGEGTVGYDRVWPGGGVGRAHVLRIEWTGTEVLFFADITLKRSLEFGGEGQWFSVSAGAYGGGRTVNGIDWVGWRYRP